MDRHIRHFTRNFRRTFRNVKSRATSFRRSNPEYFYPQLSLPATTLSSNSLTSTEDDLVFQATEEEESPENVTPGESAVLIPCEFCHIQQTSESLTRHQLVCVQNPNYDGRRRNLTATVSADASRRRVASENTSTAPPVPSRIRSPKPSAPPRSRSSSPTEGFEIPPRLVCPITHALFRDPVVASDGHTYEKGAILGCLRTSQKSPLTRGPISRETLNPSRVIKDMADEFRAECKRRRELNKYILNIDVKKLEEIVDLKTSNRTVYRAEWTRRTPLANNSNIILTHLTGDNAKELGEGNFRLGLHPNIVRTFGTVEHEETGILLLQECLPEQTLAQLIENIDEKFSITILDTILYQIASALQHLVISETIHGNITANDIFIYQLDESPEKILVKLLNTAESNEPHSEQSDVYAFGVLARDLYTLELSTNNEDLIERDNLINRCIVTDADARPTLNELIKSIIDLTQNKRFLFQ